APAAVGARVGQTPVAVDEGPARRPGGVAADVAVAPEIVERLAEARAQAGLGVAVVVQGHLGLPEAGLGPGRQGLEGLGRVLLARVEEAVARPVAVGVAEAGGQRRVALAPRGDPRPSLRRVGALPQRLVVVADREEEVARPPGLGARGAAQRAGREVARVTR